MTNETKFLISVCRSAEKLISKNFTMQDKDNKGDIVTCLDVEIEKHIVSKMQKKYPTFKILGEELNTTIGDAKDYFTIDPIDGTINFAYGLPMWGIMVACVRDGKTVSSVISLPRFNEIYYADEFGAFCDGNKIQVNSTHPVEKSIFASNNFFLDIDKKYKRMFANAAVNYCWVANGSLAGVVSGTRNPWSYICGRYLIEKAGGYILKTDDYIVMASSKPHAEFISGHMQPI